MCEWMIFMIRWTLKILGGADSGIQGRSTQKSQKTVTVVKVRHVKCLGEA